MAGWVIDPVDRAAALLLERRIRWAGSRDRRSGRSPRAPAPRHGCVSEGRVVSRCNSPRPSIDLSGFRGLGEHDRRRRRGSDRRSWTRFSPAPGEGFGRIGNSCGPPSRWARRNALTIPPDRGHLSLSRSPPPDGSCGWCRALDSNHDGARNLITQCVPSQNARSETCHSGTVRWSASAHRSPAGLVSDGEKVRAPGTYDRGRPPSQPRPLSLDHDSNAPRS